MVTGSFSHNRNEFGNINFVVGWEVSYSREYEWYIAYSVKWHKSIKRYVKWYIIYKFEWLEFGTRFYVVKFFRSFSNNRNKQYYVTRHNARNNFDTWGYQRDNL